MSNFFWLGADGEVTECTQTEFEALINEEREELRKFRDAERSKVDDTPEQYSFWGIEDSSVETGGD